MDLLALNDVDGKAESEDEIISGIKQRRVTVVTLVIPSRSEGNDECREKVTGTKPKKLLLKAESATAGVDNFEYSEVIHLWEEL